jgi:hypothetical protein
MRDSEIKARVLGLVASGALAGCFGDCDTATPPLRVAPASASVAPLYVPPPPEGCARTGSLEAVESDPACVVAQADDRTMRDAMKHLTFELKPDAPDVTAGGTLVMRLTITNGARAEVPLLLDAQPPNAGARPDWTRLAGVPEPKPAGSALPGPDGFRLMMPVRTLDAHERSVDGLPTTPSIGATSLRTLRVRLKPGGKLTQTFSWWALRIPAPGPITRDDAGHRFVPKTAPIPLAAGEYVVNVELPLHGISAPESIVSTRVKVEHVEKPDSSGAAR